MPISTRRGRKNACEACRRRKKRCDARLPSCSSCARNNVQCWYSRAANQEVDSGPSANGTQFNSTSLPARDSSGSVIDEDASTAFQTRDAIHPSSQDQHEIVAAFFESIHPILPTIHRDTFQDGTRARDPKILSSSLYYIVLTLGTPVAFEKLRIDNMFSVELWTNKAKHLLDQSLLSRSDVEGTLQTAVYVVLYDYMNANMLEMWMTLGKVLRYVCFLGLHKMDDVDAHYNTLTPAPASRRDQEIRRKAIWSLLMLDRLIPCLTGFPSSMPDNSFRVNYPLRESYFQTDTFSEVPKAFEAELHHVISPSAIKDIKEHWVRDSDGVELCYRLSVLLGRIVKNKNDLHANAHEEEHELELFQLRTAWAPLDDLVDFFTSERGPAWPVPITLIFCRILIGLCTILLFLPDIPSETGRDHISKLSLRLCSKHVHKLKDLIHVFRSREPGKPVNDALKNPLLVPAFYVCAHVVILCLDSPPPRDLSSEDLDFFLRAIDEFSPTWKPAAMKFRASILHSIGNASSGSGRGPFLNLPCSF